MHFAREGADVAIVYLKQEEKDAQETESLVKAEGRRCLLFVGDVGEAKTVDALGGLHVLVNNAGEQHFCESLADLKDATLERTFKVGGGDVWGGGAARALFTGDLLCSAASAHARYHQTHAAHHHHSPPSH